MYKCMNVHEVAASILASSHIRTAFDIASALGEVRRQLLSRFTGQLLGQLPFLVGAAPSKHEGFLRTAEGQPFLIHRVVPGARPGFLPWGGLAIGLAFDQGRLFYGICHDTTQWPAGAPPAPRPGASAGSLQGALPDGGPPREWWLCWDWAGPAAERELYPAMADNVVGYGACTLVKHLKPEVERLAAALDLYCQVTVM